jgi:uncharacterized protein
MKILVLSDTHGEIDKAVEAIEKNRDIDLIIHLGDYFRDAQKLESMFPKIPVEYIYGNSDFMIGDVPAEKMLDIKGKRIFITHGHRYSVKWDYNRLHKKAEESNADVLLFGHTHIAELIEEKGYLLINPGSISEPRSEDNESYAVIEIDEGRIRSRLVYV